MRKIKKIAVKRFAKFFKNKKVPKYLKRFVQEDDGIELIEWAVLIIIVVGLIAVAIYIGSVITDKLNEAASEIDGLGGATTPVPGGGAIPPTT